MPKDFTADEYEAYIDSLLDQGLIDRAEFDAVADDAEAVALLVAKAEGK